MYGRASDGTFSLVACDPDHRSWGVVVATKPTCVGAVVPWAEWPSGAIATQAETNYQYGPRGLASLRRGRSASDVVRRLTRVDPKRDHRQLGVVDARGNAAAWTGPKCSAWAGHVTGDGFSCQGNILANDGVVPAMVRAFEGARGTLARRLYSALVAGANAGGDRRGMESAALLIVHRERWFDPAWSDRWVDLRVDQNVDPIAELGRILRGEEATTRRFLAARTARRRGRRAPSTPARRRP
ncbi:MAG: DUF1028 domain-containing protein [Thermoplasmata archaeon]